MIKRDARGFWRRCVACGKRVWFKRTSFRRPSYDDSRVGFYRGYCRPCRTYASFEVREEAMKE